MGKPDVPDSIVMYDDMAELANIRDSSQNPHSGFGRHRSSQNGISKMHRDYGTPLNDEEGSSGPGYVK